MKLKKLDATHWEIGKYQIFKMNSGWFRVTDTTNEDTDTNYYETPAKSLAEVVRSI